MLILLFERNKRYFFIYFFNKIDESNLHRESSRFLHREKKREIYGNKIQGLGWKLKLPPDDGFNRRVNRDLISCTPTSTSTLISD